MIVLSQVLYWAGVKATFEVVEAAAGPDRAGVLRRLDRARRRRADRARAGQHLPDPHRDGEGQGPADRRGRPLPVHLVRRNFRNFSAVTIILVVMIGVGLAEAAGLIGALIRKLVGVSSKSTLTFIIVLLGIISSIASDAGYLVLIPLGAAAFLSVGRHPLAGIAAAFAGVAAGFGVNFLITPLDGVLTEITNDAAGAGARHHIDLAANLYFGIGSTIFVAIVLTFVSAKLVESRLGHVRPGRRRRGPRRRPTTRPRSRRRHEARGLRYATLGDARGRRRDRAAHVHPGRAAAQPRDRRRSSATRRSWTA